MIVLKVINFEFVSYFNSNINFFSLGKIEVVYEASNEIRLPWPEEYGIPLRGGSPTIYLKKYNLHLAFFHTLSTFQQSSVKTYFMGAVTFCNEYPSFHIHSMSPLPILFNDLYLGPWTHIKFRDYIVFPAGVTYDHNNTDYLYLSFGHQDQYGFISRMHIDSLLSSLELVTPCSSHHHAHAIGN